MKTTANEPQLSNLEWSAVSIALNDAAKCGCSATSGGKGASFSSRFAEKVFGPSRLPNALADPKLEAIRRFVCATSRRRAPAVEFVAPLAAHGFNQAQIDALALLSV